MEYTDNRLPETWLETNLGQLVQIVRGVSYKKEQSRTEPLDGYLPIIRANNIQQDELILDDLVYVEQSLIKENQKIKQNDVIVAMSSGSKSVVGKGAAAVQNYEMGFGAFCGLLRPLDTVHPKLIHYFVQSNLYRNTISALSAGANINNLKPVHFNEISFPLPPLPEQHYIAGRLDNLLARVDAAQARLQDLPTQLKYYRQAVLAAAFSGQLTADWREQTGCLKNSALQILANKNKQQEIKDGPDNRLPETWLQICLGDVIQYGKTSKIEPEQIKDNTWVLELEDIEKDSSRLLAKVYAPERKSKSSKNRFVKGDVLYGKLRPYLNKVLLADEDGICTTEIIPLSGNEYVSSEYLFYWLKSSQFIEYATQASYGLNMPRLGTKDGLKAPLILPPLPEQTEIVRRVEKLLAHADAVEQAVAHSLHQLALLKQSLLARAFSGELSAAWRTRQDGN